MSPRLVVVAPSTVDAIRAAGGWLFDLTLSGWDVGVLVPDHEDCRPLRILGARPIDPASAEPVPASGRWPDALAVDAGLFATNARTRELVWDAIAGGSKVRLWDNSAPPESPLATEAIHHRLSHAARAFKAQALAAADEPDIVVEVIESFRASVGPRPGVAPMPVA